MYVTYAVFSRLFCNAIEKGITKTGIQENVSFKSSKTTHKIKNLIKGRPGSR